MPCALLLGIVQVCVLSGWGCGRGVSGLVDLFWRWLLCVSPSMVVRSFSFIGVGCHSTMVCVVVLGVGALVLI